MTNVDSGCLVCGSVRRTSTKQLIGKYQKQNEPRYLGPFY